MTKYRSINDARPKCEKLEETYDRAVENAYYLLPGPDPDVSWGGEYGNTVTTRPFLTGESHCVDCGKGVTFNKTLEPIEARNREGEPVTLYNTMGGRESLVTSGHPCKEKRG